MAWSTHTAPYSTSISPLAAPVCVHDYGARIGAFAPGLSVCLSVRRRGPWTLRSPQCAYENISNNIFRAPEYLNPSLMTTCHRSEIDTRRLMFVESMLAFLQISRICVGTDFHDPGILGPNLESRLSSFPRNVTEEIHERKRKKVNFFLF